MSEIPDRAELLEEIELRQNDVLQQLDELNQRVEKALKDFQKGQGAKERSE